MSFWLECYRRMWLIRRFEEKVESLFARGALHGTTHTAIGQEAVAVGACAALGPRDVVLSTHRGHGHLIARGGDPNRMMAELFGRATGYSRGRGGSQMMANPAIGFWGSNGITGGGLPVAVGAALAFRLRGERRVALCFFGDGAANQGMFHESLNMAALWKLPVVFICENNGYAMSTPVTMASAVPAIALRAAAYGIPGETVDGNDVRAVRDAVAAACDHARRGQGPTLLECRTYRFSGHSRGDPRRYRTREEETAWRRNDPLRRCRAFLRQEGILDEERDRVIRREAAQRVAEAVRFARRSPWPDPASLETGVFA
jgi:pyruvate dehydrogenase E1 component alpha subunit